ncbi:MAG: DUF1464 family protein [Candidatus Methylomirabilota bacterium]
MLALGIAPAPPGWRLAMWDEYRAARLHAVASTEELWRVLRDLQDAHPAMPAVLPSGLGIPVTRAGDLLDQDIAEMAPPALPGDADGLAALLIEARRRIPRALCIPAVKLLPTVPLHRKLGRTDLGGADALCIGAWALYCLQRTGVSLETICTLLLCRQSAVRTLLVIREGRIVDGLGESSLGLLPPRASGRGGAGRPADQRPVPFRARDPLTLREAERRLPEGARLAEREAIRKEILGLAAHHGIHRLIALGAAGSEAGSDLDGGLERLILPEAGKGFEAPLGGAILAAGLTGGPTADLVDRLGLREARERPPDWLDP